MFPPVAPLITENWPTTPRFRSTRATAARPAPPGLVLTGRRDGTSFSAEIQQITRQDTGHDFSGFFARKAQQRGESFETGTSPAAMFQPALDRSAPDFLPVQQEEKLPPEVPVRHLAWSQAATLERVGQGDA